MGGASAADVRSYSAFINRLNVALQLRAEAVLVWRSAPQGHVAEIPEGKLLLSWRRDFATLTVIYEVGVEVDGEPRTVERGRRVVSVGLPGRLQRIALDLAMHGVPGAPAFTGGELAWDRVVDDGSRRMVVPDGELRISRPEVGGAMLTFEGDTGMELLGAGDDGVLERQALIRWQKRTERPLQVVVKGQVAKLRSLAVPGLVGYTPVTDNSFVALARAGEELALLYIEGCYPRLAVRISLDEAVGGEPLDVDALLKVARRGAANHGPAANEVLREVLVPEEPGVQVGANPGPQAGAAAPASEPLPRPICPPHCSPMAEPHRRLCERHLRRLLGLRGRGARKARAIVRLILEKLESCRLDIAGTRQEVHRELERLLEQRLVGGDRNIRDALDLLVKHSLLFRREEGTRCRVRFSELHDPNSELMRHLAAEAAAVIEPATVGAVEGSGGEAEPTATEPAPVEETPEPTVGPPEAPSASVDIMATAGLTATAAPSIAATSQPSAPSGMVDTRAVVEPEGVAGDPLAEAPKPGPGEIADASAAPAREAGPSMDSRASPAPNHADTGPPLSSRPGSGDSEGSRNVPIIPRVGKPRGLESSMRGFTRLASRGEPLDPLLDRPGAPSRMMWETREDRTMPDGDDQDSS